MLENTGEAAVAGYTEENVSWRNPGRVSSSVRTAPPGSSAASSTVTARPARARAMAAASPLSAADHDGVLDHGSGDPKRELVQHREPLDPLGAGVAGDDLPPERVLRVAARAPA